MSADRQVTALIPARGGSKGFPGKNLALLGGRTLLAWTIRAARDSQFIERVVLSTDSEEIADEGRRAGAQVPFLRPPEYATDEASTTAVAQHMLRALCISSGYLVLLQPTSPLRTTEDIDACILAAKRPGASGCVSVTAIDKSPYWMYRLGSDGELIPYFETTARPKRRQDAAPAYVLNGAVYVVPVSEFEQTGNFVPDGCLSHVMPSHRSIDIDKPEDLEVAEQFLARAHRDWRAV